MGSQPGGLPEAAPDPQVWSRALDLFTAYLGLTAEQRAEEMTRLQAEAPAVHAAVDALIRADPVSSTGLQVDLPEVAQQLFAGTEELAPGTMVGPYRVECVLGAGGMGTVYRAVHAGYKGAVALKVLSSLLSPAGRQRFELEKEHLARFTHPGIAQIYYADALPDGTAYFAMEYVEGQRITEACRAGRLSLRNRLELFLKVCAAVQAAHGEGIIHRDLKPSNILVRPDGEVKLLDFGISERSDASAAPDSRFLSLPYAPPEHSGAPAGVRGDVYSLGMVLFEMITGELPFASRGLDAAHLRESMRQRPWRRPSELVAENPEKAGALGKVSRTDWKDIDQICAKTTAAEPGERYATVDALARDVSLHLQSRPLETVHGGWLYRSRRFLRRNRAPISLVGAAALCIAVLIAVYTVRLQRSRDAAVAEAAHAERVESFLERMLQGEGGDAGPSKDMTVLALLKAGVHDAEALSDDPRLQADLFDTLGGVYDGLGAFDKADQLLQTALAKRIRMYGRDSAETSKTLLALSKLRVDQRRLPEAEKLGQEALGIDTRKLPPNAPETLSAETALADVYIHLGESARAIPILESVARYATGKPKSLTDLSTALGELAIAQDNLGHLEAAEIAAQQSLALDRQLVGDLHPDIASDEMDLAGFAQERGRYAEAAAHATQALHISENWFGPNHPEVAAALTFLGQALTDQAQDKQALPLLQRALVIQEQTFPGAASPTAQTLNALASAESGVGDLQQSAVYYGRAIGMYRVIYPRGSASTGVVLSNASKVQLKLHAYTRAEAMLREALRLETQALPADDARVGTANYRLGQVLLAEKRPAEAEPFLLASYRTFSKRDGGDSRSRPIICQTLAEAYTAMHNEARAAFFRSQATAPPS